MQIKSLDIKNYKAFGEQSDSITFGIPDNENPGSGLTIFVGPNNAGKSTALETLLKFDEKKRIIDEDKRKSAELKIEIIDKDSKSKIVSTKGQSSQIIISGNSTFSKSNIEFIPSRRPWSHRFSGSLNIDLYRNHGYSQERRIRVDDQLPRLLDNIHRNRKDDFTALMRKVIPGFSEWNIKTDRQGDYISYSLKDTNIEHDIDLLGDGTINLFAIATYLLEQNKNNILIIDEPELSLHPQAQRRLFEILKERSKEKQIIISTHSPYFVDADILKSIRKFELNQSESDLEVKIYTASADLKVNEPAIFSFWHRDLFFAQKAIFVEGPEDYTRLKTHLLKKEKEKAETIHQLYPLYGKNNREFFDKFCSTFSVEKYFILDIDYIEDDIKEFLNKGIAGVFNKKWYIENFDKIKTKYEEKKKELKKENTFIWSKPDIKDVLDVEGNPVNGMGEEIEECIEFICGKSRSNK